MADYDETPSRTTAGRRFDLFSLVAGIAALLMAVYTGTGGEWVDDLPAFDLRWVLAGGAVFVGTVMLIASMRGKKR